LTWDSTLGEIQQRYGEARRVWLDGDDSAGTADIIWTIEELYRSIHCRLQDVAQLRVRETHKSLGVAQRKVDKE
jgi:hypothetical protein